MSLRQSIGNFVSKFTGALQAVDGRGRGNWWPVVREPFQGAWQRNIEWSRETVLAHHAVYACITRISNDIGYMPFKIMQVDDEGIWNQVAPAAFMPLLRKPNPYQNHIQFKQSWILSKLEHGNMYGLKRRDARGIVTSIYVLNPIGAQVLVSPDGSIFYQFQTDNLTGIEDSQVAIPASEIVHDRMNCLFHPLVGISPLYASGAIAAHGLKLQEDATIFFANGANPGGVLTAPGAISDETAARLQEKWSANFTGKNAGKVAVMGDGLRYEAMRMKYSDAQFIEQMKMDVDAICSTFGVHPFKIGMGSVPAGMKVGDMEMLYANNALRSLIEEMEACMDEAQGFDASRRTELETETLLRMDPLTMADVYGKQVKDGLATPNEGRRAFNRGKIKGGDTIYLQQQQYSVEALAERDANSPFAKPVAATPATSAVSADEPTEEEIAEEQARQFIEYVQKGLTNA